MLPFEVFTVSGKPGAVATLISRVSVILSAPLTPARRTTDAPTIPASDVIRM